MSGWDSDEDNRYREEAQRHYQQQPQQQQQHGSRSYYRNREDRDQEPRHAQSEGDVVLVPSDKVGMIIGRGGAKINELQSTSGARINVDRNRSEDGNTRVNLSGSEEAKNEARRLIEEIISDVRDSKPGRYRNDRQNNSSSSYSFNCDENRQNNSHSSYSNDRDEGQQSNTGSSYSYTYTKYEDDGEPVDWQKLYQDCQKKKWEAAKLLTPILKKFYIEDPAVAAMTVKEVAEWRLNNNDIHVNQIDGDGKDIHDFKIPNPVQTFEQCFKAYPEILEEIRKQGFSRPSPIQSQAWPVLLSGQDMIGIAQTGTGKTLAFLLPALIHIEKQTIPIEDREGPNVLVLAPTRELAIQIENEVKKYHYRGIKSVCIYGGADKHAQVNKVSKGVQIVIATPGRLNDLVNGGHINLKGVTYIVLDEADRMLDMGFGPQITLSLQTVRPDRQTVMTSATWPLMVQRLALNMMLNPVRIVVGTLDLAAVNTVTQKFIFTEDSVEEKFKLLVEFLQEMDPDDKLIVFCSKKATTIDVSSDLGIMGYNIQSIYGGLAQEDREQALEDMRTDTVNILIATDLASRGIDIEDVTHIINFDFPHNLEEFVHRVGRTGRAGKSGTAITYITRRDWSSASGLIDILKNANQEVPQELNDMADRFSKMLEKRKEEGGDDRRRSGGGRGGGGRGGGSYNNNRSGNRW